MRKVTNTNYHQRLLCAYKVAVMCACSLFVTVSHAAISPWDQQRLNIGAAIEFLEKHPLVLHGLKRIALPSNDKVVLVYHFQQQSGRERGKVKTCYATFTPSFFAMLSPKQTVSYSGSTCPIAYEDEED